MLFERTPNGVTEWIITWLYGKYFGLEDGADFFEGVSVEEAGGGGKG